MTKPVLELQHVGKNYDTTVALKDISFTVSQGETVVLLGPSGCGKSTLLRCINGLETIQSGNILLDGKSITDGKNNWRETRQRIGMVFQSYPDFILNY